VQGSQFPISIPGTSTKDIAFAANGTLSRNNYMTNEQQRTLGHHNGYTVGTAPSKNTGVYGSANLQKYSVPANPAPAKPAKRGFTNAELVAAANRKSGGASKPYTGGASLSQVADSAIGRRQDAISNRVFSQSPRSPKQERQGGPGIFGTSYWQTSAE
jgi:hypothetical protein